MPFDESTDLGKRVLYLRSRGYDIGEEVAAKKVLGEVDQVCVAVGNTLYTGQQIERLGFYESCKDEDANVDGLGMKYMAQDCLRISNHPSVDSHSADEGRELAGKFKAWEMGLELTAQARVLCKRMAHFLTREFYYLWH